MTDFGADCSFAQVPNKLEEHYGIRLASSSIRHITEGHAKRIHESQVLIKDYPSTLGKAYVIAEMDGSMIPIVEIDETAPDKRKGKKESWKEARLCLAHAKGSVTPTFGAIFGGTVEDAGKILFDTACRAGFGKSTFLHAVGDGASWIKRQVDEQFGTQGHYLIDLYHVCEYLSAASASCSCLKDKDKWFAKQKKALQDGQAQAVIDTLKPFLEAETVEESNAPVRACHRYLSNRIEQLDYPTAKSLGLPVGSGEIESAHRYIIQQRLKKSGAWWKSDNAADMLALRVMRGNQQWKHYWRNTAEAA